MPVGETASSHRRPPVVLDVDLLCVAHDRYTVRVPSGNTAIKGDLWLDSWDFTFSESHENPNRAA